jgi:hypothetical protein
MGLRPAGRTVEDDPTAVLSQVEMSQRSGLLGGPLGVESTKAKADREMECISIA